MWLQFSFFTACQGIVLFALIAFAFDFILIQSMATELKNYSPMASPLSF